MPMKKNSLYISCILAFAVTLLYIRCMDDPLFHAEKQPVSAEPESETLRAMKHCFEENATTLKQVHANLAYNPHTRGDNETHTSCCTAHSNNTVKGNINITPMWDAARMWEGKKRMYAEVPLKGKGMHVAAYVQSGDKKKVYLANNLLMLTKDKENEEIHYYVVTALADLSKYTTKAKQKKLFQFVGNADFEGIVIFSKTDGTFVKAMHVHDGKSHPIIFGHTHALPATRSQNGNTDNEGSTLTLTSELASYSGEEIGGGGLQEEFVCKCDICTCIDCPKNKVYCAICGEYYDINWESCPNNCDVTITPGGGGGGGGGIGIDYYVTCPYCLMPYSTLLHNECPFGCNKRCDVCGHYPCTCVNIEDNHRCERCGSPDCPGPWVCGGNGDYDNECIGEKCPVCNGYKSTTRSSSNCPACICNAHTISLWKNPIGIIDLGSQYTLTIMNTSQSKSKIIKIEYNIFNTHGMVASYEPETFSSNITYIARSPGYWKIQAVATFEDGETATSNMLNLTIQNPLYSDIMNNPAVKAKMDALWNAAVRDALSEPPVYHEKGCIIYFNTANNSYEFEDVPDSKEFNCEGVIEITFNLSAPNGYYVEGRRYPVATFHTHPARTKCDQYIQYAVGPSDVDKNIGTVCLLYDYIGDNGKISGGHSAKDTYQLYHCAQKRHPLN